MDFSQIPSPVLECCRVLRGAGFAAYPVGGGVRDLLLGRVPADWDVCTAARPEQVRALFPEAVPTGVRHGTVTLPAPGGAIEVTTFRSDGAYSDGRHPDAVTFGGTLEEDLARRDFTVNAMALSPDGSVIDPFGGRSDLAAGRIRCVGDPDTRFQEDALRMFRAVRFSAQLDFTLDPGLPAAIRRNAPRAAALSAERVRAELEHTLLTPRPERAADFFSLGLMASRAGGLPGSLSGLNELPCEKIPRWAGLCAALRETGAVPGAGEFLRGLRLDGRTLRACTRGEALFAAGLPSDPRTWRHTLAQSGEDACRAAAAMSGAESLAELDRLLAGRPCVSVRDLALSGGEIVRLGYPGARAGQAQRFLLRRVLDCPEENTRQRLTALLQTEFPSNRTNADTRDCEQ